MAAGSTARPDRSAGGWLGKSVLRTEDMRFLTGTGQYVDDIVLPGMLHAAMVRSPYAHALIKHIDCSRALEMPGVYGVLTGDEIVDQMEPEKGSSYPRGGHWYYMAIDRARFAGEIVAIVAAEDRYLAEDAAAAIEVEYEPQPVIFDPERATDPDQPILHPEAEGGNEALFKVLDFGDVETAFAQADVVVSERLVMHRHTSVPLEGLAVISQFNPHTKQTTVWANLGNLGRYTAAARALKMDHGDIRLIVPDVGGSFGIKAWVHHRAVLLSLLSRKVGRPVKWIEDRLEHLAASHHGTPRIGYVDMAVKRSGEILGVKMRIIDDQGAYTCINEPFGAQMILGNGVVGCYRLQNIHIEFKGVLTNKCPVASNRGYGRVQHFFLLERIVDRAAQAIGMDAAELRMKNFIPADAYPYPTPSGALYDSGDAPGLMNKTLELLDYAEARRQQAEARRQGRLIGIGFAAATEAGGPKSPGLAAAFGLTNQKARSAVDVATVQVGPDGRLIVQAPTLAQGQGHETTIAQIVADRFGVDPNSVRVVVTLDSGHMPYSAVGGTYGSRFASTGAMAAYGAAKKLADQLAESAAHLLEAAPEDVEFRDGNACVVGVPERSISLKQLAATLHTVPDVLNMGQDVPVGATFRWTWPDPSPGGNTYAVMCHGAMVEVDPETGKVTVLKYVATEDAGRLMNPMIVRGITMGGVIHGLGWALTEDIIYNEDGQLMTGTFMDYLPMRFTDIPPLSIAHIECPTPFTPLGAKGMGEGGAITPPACIANAVEDAIAHLGGRIMDSHLSPETVLTAIHQAGARSAG